MEWNSVFQIPYSLSQKPRLSTSWWNAAEVETKVGRLQSGKAIRLAPLGKEDKRGEGGQN
jgi:hypothetical protein